jgi:hypothetical protein
MTIESPGFAVGLSGTNRGSRTFAERKTAWVLRHHSERDVEAAGPGACLAIAGGIGWDPYEDWERRIVRFEDAYVDLPTLAVPPGPPPHCRIPGGT